MGKRIKNINRGNKIMAMKDALGIPINRKSYYAYVHKNKYEHTNRVCIIQRITKTGVTVKVIFEARVTWATYGRGAEVQEYYNTDKTCNIMSCKLFPIPNETIKEMEIK